MSEQQSGVASWERHHRTENNYWMLTSLSWGLEGVNEKIKPFRIWTHLPLQPHLLDPLLRTLSLHQAVLSLTSLFHTCCSPATSTPTSFLQSAWLTPTCSLGHSWDIILGLDVSHLCINFPQQASVIHLIQQNVTCLLLSSPLFPHPTANSTRAAALPAFLQRCLSCP